MGTDWRGFEVNRAEWLDGRAASLEHGSPLCKSNLTWSGVGLGTAGFQPTNATHTRHIIEVTGAAIYSGIRIIDTATNYGQGFAEVVVGAAMRRAVLDGRLNRRDITIVSKVGYLPHALAGGPIHSIDPDFLRGEIAASQRRTGLATIDAYLLHNPEEQMASNGVGWAGITDAFRELEAAATTGHIGCYGVSAAEGFLAGEPEFHSLERLLSIARLVGGDDHHFRIIELPISLWRRDSFATTPYHIGGRPASTLDLAAQERLLVLGSSPMGGGRDASNTTDLLRLLFPTTSIKSPTMLALQFARSIPDVHGVLAGITNPAHLEEVITTMHMPRWDLGRMI